MKHGIWTLKEFKNESSLGFFHRRNNFYLTKIDEILLSYHLSGKQSPEREVNLLLSLGDACETYYDYKCAHHHRATAVIALYAQIKKRISTLIAQRITGHNIGHGHHGWDKVKAAISPLVQGASGSAGKARLFLHQNYWDEAVTKDHFHISQVIPNTQDPMSEWKESSSPLHFIDWVRDCYIPDLIEKRKGRELLWQLKSGVEYLDKDKRPDKIIHIKNGVFYNSHGERFHTGSMQTHVSGKGWAIFVMAPDNNIYSHSHKLGVFHHSSFLSGGVVQAAGEIAVNNGKVVAINNKSGHYRPDTGSMVRILFWLKHHGADLKSIAACPQIKEGVREYFNAEEVLMRDGQPGFTRVIPEKVPRNINE